MSPTPPFEPHAFFAELGALVAAHRHEFSRPWRYAVRLAEGPCYLLDVSRESVVSHEWRPDADAVMLLNVPTLAAIVNGTLDVSDPQRGEVFVATGSLEALGELGQLLGPPRLDAMR